MSATAMGQIGREKATANEMVSFGSLSEMTGFPVEFIKKELLIEEDPVCMDKLRSSMLKYLESTMGQK